MRILKLGGVLLKVQNGEGVPCRGNTCTPSRSEAPQGILETSGKAE